MRTQFSKISAGVVGIAGSMFATSVAHAGFQYSTIRTNNAVTVGPKTYDQIVFRVLNDGLPATSPENNLTYSGTGTDVLAMQLNIASTAPMRWRFADLAYPLSFNALDGIPDVDVIAPSQSSMGSTQFTGLSPVLFAQFLASSVTPGIISTSTYSAPSAYTTATTVTDFNGFAITPPAANLTPFAFITVLAEAGSTVSITGLVTASVGPIVGLINQGPGSGGAGAGGVGAGGDGAGGPPVTARFAVNATSVIPEPAGLAGLAFVGSLMLRRRSA